MAVTLFRKKKSKDPVSVDMANKQKRYEALVNALHGDLYRYAYWLCHSPDIAEDLVQETFLRAWRSLDSLKDEKAAKSWLFTIVRRENARRFERKQFDVVDIDDQPVADQQSVSTEQDTENHLLRRQIAMLAPEYREPLILQVLGGFSGDEIAEQLGLNKNTVMTRLFRARNQLKEALETSDRKRGHSNG
ncbi:MULTISPECIES: sigma-70 family RNA polymerase sigma factor [Corallincola]|uniref:RNA polymerase sigma factor n=3 Tax=Corallincola TaxID=1775176 RepID=A0A368NFA8_9GAMM|nr:MULTISPECIES: sigma-70 family RNA polymerase sigma factor [Corallincola]RCU48896.1 RNA polymerase subunit sigma [Corallincola holothuriorum]TAA43788.1 sigma-70 family RNA polymerase sigma factor [Corallincola spongiicola]TCI03035.1 sigma-70 family RNA polymerase sigma factor [Corallincola luteus]